MLTTSAGEMTSNPDHTNLLAIGAFVYSFGMSLHNFPVRRKFQNNKGAIVKRFQIRKYMFTLINEAPPVNSIFQLNFTAPHPLCI